MRSFIAIDLPEPVATHLRHVRDALPKPRAVSWVRPENWHLTLKFLGDVETRRIDDLVAALRLAATVAPFELSPDKLDCFPPHGPVRIIAIAIGGQTGPLKQLQSEIELRLEPLGFPRESRPFTGHITLGRARSPLRPGMRSEFETAALPLAVGPSFHVDAIHLMQSELTPAGSVYTELQRIALYS